MITTSDHVIDHICASSRPRCELSGVGESWQRDGSTVALPHVNTYTHWPRNRPGLTERGNLNT